MVTSLDRNCAAWRSSFEVADNKPSPMKKPTIRNIKKIKAVLGLVTAVFSLAIAIQQVYHLKKDDLAQA